MQALTNGLKEWTTNPVIDEEMHMNMKLMALVALPLLARAEAALDPVAYLDWNATTKTFVAKECSSYTVVTAGMSDRCLVRSDHDQWWNGHRQ